MEKIKEFNGVVKKSPVRKHTHAETPLLELPLTAFFRDK